MAYQDEVNHNGTTTKKLPSLYNKCPIFCLGSGNRFISYLSTFSQQNTDVNIIIFFNYKMEGSLSNPMVFIKHIIHQYLPDGNKV